MNISIEYFIKDMKGNIISRWVEEISLMDGRSFIQSPKLPENVEAGVYANAVSVNVNKNEFILDFAYNIPNTSE